MPGGYLNCVHVESERERERAKVTKTINRVLDETRRRQIDEETDQAWQWYEAERSEHRGKAKRRDR